MTFFILIWSLSNLAFIALASSMSKHQKQIFARELGQKYTIIAAICGWSLLALSLSFCLMMGRLSTQLSYWVGVLTFSALFIGLCLSYYSPKIKMITLICLMISLIAGMTQLI
ncbi:DUF3325 domain-containing protein [Acinetobacter piscicola]|uniref:DUF3325 domain-containing protein n=1 Tax=Acinetobacter piscicola TaxID=2006115 RepID=UPI000B7FAD47|nr:DUF3325 domain-containing protein [Acinetobacter piscicola]